MSSGPSGPQDTPRGSLVTAERLPHAVRAQRVRFRRALALMLMTLVVPGSAQLVAGNRRVGRVAMRTWLALVVLVLAAAVTGLLDRGFVFWAVSDTLLLGVVRVALMGLAIAWAYLIVDAWRLGRPLSLRREHRLAVVGLNGLLCFSVAGGLLFGAHVVGVQRDFLQTMFGDGEVVGAHEGRFNVLLLGGDSGAGRWGLRPDSITVASIDARTGETVLIGLPRNLAGFPFAEGSPMAERFPRGFDCDGCYINGVSTWAQDHTELFDDPDQAGTDATIMAVEGVTGLKINYWAMVNLQGFKDLVDAVGGVELNVRDRIPVGGLGDDVTGYIEPGVRRLDGHDTLWFARSREGSDDYSRMARQKCVMNAMLQQVSPEVAVRNFQRIADAGTQMISTDLPGSEVGRFIDLALKARSQRITTLSLVPPMIDTADPDVELIHRKVAEATGTEPVEVALAAQQQAPEAGADAGTGPGTDEDTEAEDTEAPAAPETSAPATSTQEAEPDQGSPPTPTPVTGGSLGSLREGYAANEAADLGAAC